MTAPHKQISSAAACTGKVRFDSFSLADRVNQDRRKGKGSVKRSAYHCAYCLGWHLGRRNAAPKRQNTKHLEFETHE